MARLKTLFDRRNMSVSDPYIMTTGRANWSKWTVRKAVSEGLHASGWVYRAISLISRNGSSVPWVVFDKENASVPDHPVSKVLERPNKMFSQQDLMELLINWMQLSGNSYLHGVYSGDRLLELWPVSPDRISPIPSKEPGLLVDGYEVITPSGQMKRSADYTTDNIMHFKLLDPSNPVTGIGPLQAAARAVDTDREQQDWNKSAMENRGVFDGVFTFKEQLDVSAYSTIVEKLKERFSGASNARTPAVVGADAKYQRMSVTPAEMDFIDSRKFNREEIFIIFGVPSQLAGAMDSATYNNYATSMRIFWENTLIPLLDDIADTLNSFLQPQLEGGYRIKYDTSAVRALRESEDERAKTAKSYWDMGVPVATINEKMDLGISEFDGWDKPFSGFKPQAKASGDSDKEGDQRSAAGWQLIPLERRNVEQEQARRDDLAEGPVQKMFAELLNRQQAAVFKALEDDTSLDDAIKAGHDAWLASMRSASAQIATEFAGTVVVGERGRRPSMERRDAYDDAINSAIDEYLIQEDMMLRDLSMMEATTASAVIDQVADGMVNGATVSKIQQALIDVGIFSEERALMLARTLAGTAASIGQMAGAEVAGAKRKEWMNSGFEVREIHVARGGEKVDLDAKFSNQGHGAPRFPLDPNLGPADRVNCRCSMVFE